MVKKNCTVIVTINRNTICGTTVIFPQSEKWEDLENLYIYFKSIKTGKGILDKIKITFKKTIFRSEESRRLIAGIESDKASHKTDHDI